MIKLDLSYNEILSLINDAELKEDFEEVAKTTSEVCAAHYNTHVKNTVCCRVWFFQSKKTEAVIDKILFYDLSETTSLTLALVTTHFDKSGKFVDLEDHLHTSRESGLYTLSLHTADVYVTVSRLIADKINKGDF